MRSSHVISQVIDLSFDDVLRRVFFESILFDVPGRNGRVILTDRALESKGNVAENDTHTGTNETESDFLFPSVLDFRIWHPIF